MESEGGADSNHQRRQMISGSADFDALVFLFPLQMQDHLQAWDTVSPAEIHKGPGRIFLGSLDLDEPQQTLFDLTKNDQRVRFG